MGFEDVEKDKMAVEGTSNWEAVTPGVVEPQRRYPAGWHRSRWVIWRGGTANQTM